VRYIHTSIHPTTYQYGNKISTDQLTKQLINWSINQRFLIWSVHMQVGCNTNSKWRWRVKHSVTVIITVIYIQRDDFNVLVLAMYRMYSNRPFKTHKDGTKTECLNVYIPAVFW